MAIEKFIIDKSDLPALLKGEDIAIQPKRNIKGFCVQIAGNITNGDMIKAVFSDSTKYEFGILDSLKIVTMFVTSETNQAFYVHFDLEWWNAPYKREEKENE